MENTMMSPLLSSLLIVLFIGELDFFPYFHIGIDSVPLDSSESLSEYNPLAEVIGANDLTCRIFDVMVAPNLYGDIIS